MRSKAASAVIAWRAMRMPFRLFDRRAATECSLQALVFGEALQGDVDCALQFVGAAVDDVGEDAALGGFVDVGGIVGVEDRDHGAGGFSDDLRDQFQRVLGARSEPDEGDVGALAGCGRADFLDVDLACDHVVSEPDHDLREQFEPVALLVGDQDAQVLEVGIGHIQLA